MDDASVAAAYLTAAHEALRAFPIEPAALAEVVTALQRRFKRKLDASVVIEPGLIGGIRVVVGDEVLDTLIRARLEQMKAALVA